MCPSIVLSALHSFVSNCEMGIVISILQMEKLRFREINNLSKVTQLANNGSDA